MVAAVLAVLVPLVPAQPAAMAVPVCRLPTPARLWAMAVVVAAPQRLHRERRAMVVAVLPGLAQRHLAQQIVAVAVVVFGLPEHLALAVRVLSLSVPLSVDQQQV